MTEFGSELEYQDSRETRWQKRLDELSRVADKLNEPIEPGIIETVAGLNLHDVITTQSCEGHLERALPYPWVEIGAEYIDTEEAKISAAYDEAERLQSEGSPEEENAAWERYAEFQKRFAAARDAKALELHALLEEFYANRTSEAALRIGLRKVFNRYRLQSLGAASRKMGEGNEDFLRGAQAEMKAFTAFLKQRFISSQEN